MTDYNQIIIDIGKAKNIHDVVGVQENGKDVFDRGEKIKFINSLLGKVPEEQLKRTQETAVLFVKVKQARQLRKKDLRLRNELDKEKADNSIAYQVLNDRDELVDEAIDHINLLEHFGIPEGKTKIQERIDKIEPEIEKLKRSQSEKNKIRRKYSATERLEKEKIENAKATLRKKENLLVVLQAMMDANNTDASNREITNEDGTKTRLGNLTANITINDYTGKGLTESKIDSSGNPTYEPVDTTSSVVTKTALKCIRENALGFLNSIVRKTSEPTYFETSVDNSHNQRRFNAKVNYHIVDSFSWSFFKVLREIGFTKLEKVIEASSNKSSDKKKLKKYAEEIIEFITPEEAMFGIKDYVAHSLVLKNTQDYYALAKSYDRFQKTLISKKLNEFPYEPKPNWKKVFELMHKVFPAIYSGSK